MAQPFVGQVIAAGFNFAPYGWLLCDGTLYPITQFDALYSLIGTTYGGDGQTTFAVPDLRGRSPVSIGQGPGLSNYVLGQRAGTEEVTLLAAQVGAHNHNLMASSNTGTSNTPTNTTALGGNALTVVPTYAQPPPGGVIPLAANAIGPTTGGGQPHPNLQPLQCLNYIIAWAGIYPSHG